MEYKNKFRIDGGVIWVLLTQGKETCLDLADWGKVKTYKWCAVKSKGDIFYARAFINGVRTKLHNFLIGGSGIDHKDGDGLNNKRNNLRRSTQAENARNRATPSTNISGFKGVRFQKDAQIRVAYITANKKRIFLGVFEDREKAAIAYNDAALQYHGEFARFNKIPRLV